VVSGSGVYTRSEASSQYASVKALGLLFTSWADSYQYESPQNGKGTHGLRRTTGSQSSRKLILPNLPIDECQRDENSKNRGNYTKCKVKDNFVCIEMRRVVASVCRESGIRDSPKTLVGVHGAEALSNFQGYSSIIPRPKPHVDSARGALHSEPPATVRVEALTVRVGLGERNATSLVIVDRGITHSGDGLTGEKPQ
jgi:hypothetical protein